MVNNIADMTDFEANPEGAISNISDCHALFIARQTIPLNDFQACRCDCQLLSGKGHNAI